MARPLWGLWIGVIVTTLVGCQTTAPSWTSRPTSRSDDPLLCTDAERKRSSDVYATTSQPRYQAPAPGGNSR